MGKEVIETMGKEVKEVNVPKPEASTSNTSSEEKKAKVFPNSRGAEVQGLPPTDKAGNRVTQATRASVVDYWRAVSVCRR